MQEIPNTEWFTHARSSYVIVPIDLDYTVHISGYADGTMTFTSHQITNTEQTLQHKVPVNSITGSTTVTIEYASQSFAPLAVDEDGDGGFEYQLTLTGEKIVATSTKPATYAGLYQLVALSIDDTRAVELLSGLLRLT